MEEQRLREIDQLRQKLVELVGQRGTFLDSDVLALSQQLDILIVSVQAAHGVQARPKARTRKSPCFSPYGPCRLKEEASSRRTGQKIVGTNPPSIRMGEPLKADA